MTSVLNEDDREFPPALIESVYREKFHELHHTDTADFKTPGKHEIGILDTLRQKLGADRGVQSPASERDGKPRLT